MKQLRWAGSLRAQEEYNQAVNRHPPKSKSKAAKKRKAKAAKKGRQPQQPRFWKTYPEYIASSWWKRRRKRAIRRAGGKCEHCSASDVTLHGHHKSYARLGCERDEDLEALCLSCHGRQHAAVLAMNAHLDAIAKGR